MYSFIAVLSLCSMLHDPLCKAPVLKYGAHKHANEITCLKEATEMFAENYKEGVPSTITFSIKCERKNVDPDRMGN